MESHAQESFFDALLSLSMHLYRCQLIQAHLKDPRLVEQQSDEEGCCCGAILGIHWSRAQRGHAASFTSGRCP